MHGHKLRLITADDNGSVSQDLTAAQDLVSKGVFGVIAATPFLFGSYRYLQQQGVPVVGGGYDGPEWGQRPNTNMFSVTGNIAPTFLVENTGLATFFKQQGATDVAGLGYGISPSSSDAAIAFTDTAKALGLKVGYVNTSIPFGSVNVTTIVLAMKQANVDGVYMAMDNNTNFAILTGAKQAGLHLKVALAATGYGSSLFQDPAAVQAAQGAYFASEGPPLSSPAEKSFRAALKKYEGFGGIPGFDWYEGYINADLMIKGLEVAGKNPTRSAFITNLHKVKGYTAGGLLPNPIDLSLTHFGQAPKISCGWYTRLEGTTFVPVPPSGKPVCGKYIGIASA